MNDWEKYHEIKGRLEVPQMMIVAYAKLMRKEAMKPAKDRTAGLMKSYQSLMLDEAGKVIELEEELEAERKRLDENSN